MLQLQLSIKFVRHIELSIGAQVCTTVTMVCPYANHILSLSGFQLMRFYFFTFFPFPQWSPNHRTLIYFTLLSTTFSSFIECSPEIWSVTFQLGRHTSKQRRNNSSLSLLFSKHIFRGYSIIRNKKYVFIGGDEQEVTPQSKILNFISSMLLVRQEASQATTRSAGMWAHIGLR